MPLFPDNTGNSNANNQKYNPPADAPPNYGQQIHHDAGPYQPPTSPAPQFNNQLGSPVNNAYGAPTVPDPAYGGYYNQNQQGYWGQQPGYGYGYPGYGYGPQQQQGYYGASRGGPSAGEGICAGLLGALACCCCLDLMF